MTRFSAAEPRAFTFTPPHCCLRESSLGVSLPRFTLIRDGLRHEAPSLRATPQRHGHHYLTFEPSSPLFAVAHAARERYSSSFILFASASFTPFRLHATPLPSSAAIRRAHVSRAAHAIEEFMTPRI